jgi:uncharacterized OB-fold protein
MSASRPLPNPDPLTRPYWEGAKARRLVLPRCDACDQWHFYPRSVCPHCGSDAIAWHDASGKGVIYSVTHVHRAPSPAFEAMVPYAVAIVALDEGPHLMSAVIGSEIAQVKIDAPVTVDFVDEGDITLPVFRLASAAKI